MMLSTTRLRSNLRLILSLIFFSIFSVSAVLAQDIDTVIVAKSSSQKFNKHTSNGFILASEDGKFEMQIGARLQLRFAVPDDQDPVTFADFSHRDYQVFKVNRARLKVGGHAYQPWLKYFFEYDLGRGIMLDYRVMIEKWPWLNIKAGQWKVAFTRERFISSGNQQLIDRSILNRQFTVDRQQGIEVNGNLDGGGIANFNYWLGTFTGTGRGATQNDDNKMMYFGRFQWNFLGTEMPFSGGDLGISEKPVGSIAIAGVKNTSPYTRFSSSGGGNLVGFEGTNQSQYEIKQFQIETAFNYKGFSWSSEFHRKHITDHIDQGTTQLGGFYATAGYFFNQSFAFWPEPLEMAARYAVVKPNLSVENNKQIEAAIGLNWFFAGHKNKLSTELARYEFQDIMLAEQNEYRFRIQWDISF